MLDTNPLVLRSVDGLLSFGIIAALLVRRCHLAYCLVRAFRVVEVNVVVKRFDEIPRRLVFAAVEFLGLECLEESFADGVVVSSAQVWSLPAQWWMVSGCLLSSCRCFASRCRIGRQAPLLPYCCYSSRIGFLPSLLLRSLVSLFVSF